MVGWVRVCQYATCLHEPHNLATVNCPPDARCCSKHRKGFSPGCKVPVGIHCSFCDRECYLYCTQEMVTPIMCRTENCWAVAHFHLSYQLRLCDSYLVQNPSLDTVKKDVVTAHRQQRDIPLAHKLNPEWGQNHLDHPPSSHVIYHIHPIGSW